jgi:AcrR family transcriptional regulator
MAGDRDRETGASPGVEKVSKTRDTFHHGDLACAALASALRLVRREGRPGITLRAVAADIGVNHRALYRHFPSLEALLLEVARCGFEELVREVNKAPAHADATPEARLARSYMSFALAEPNLYDLMYSLPLRKLFQAEDGPGPALRALVAEASAVYGTAKPSKIIRDKIIRVWGLCHGLAMLYRAGALPARTKHDALEYIAASAGCFGSG